MKLNLNIACKFVLTEEGAKVWNDQYLVIPAEYRPAPKCADEKVSSQLWVVMSVFGKFIHIGMGAVFFKDNNIEIDDFDAVQG